MTSASRPDAHRGRPGRRSTVRIGAVVIAALASGSEAVEAGTIRGTVTCPEAPDCRGALVWVDAIPGMEFPPGPEATIDQRQLSFVPRVLTVSAGTAVVFPNSDDLWHNVFSASDAKRFNLGSYPKGQSRRMVFDKPGVIELLCNVHPEMSAYIVVTGTPYVARVEPDGTYALKDVPGGDLSVAAWIEGTEVRRVHAASSNEGTVRVDFVLRR